jgi:hypothetical protein
MKKTPPKITKLDEFLDYVKEFDNEAKWPTGHDNAIIGVVERFGMEPVIALDKRKIIRTLMQRDGMTEAGAIEFFDYNIIGAWVGKGTPAYVTFVKDLI